MFAATQSLVLLVLTVVFFGVKAFALVDCIRRQPADFPAAERRTKTFWLVILAISAATAIVASPIGIFGLIGLVAALVYLFDVRPRLAEIDSWRR